MSGSTNPFGKSSLSPFDSQSVFGQTNASKSNPFSPKPFGSTTPSGSQTSSFSFGGTSTNLFGAPQTSSPFSSTTTFGCASSPAFGSSLPDLGSSSTSAFGNSSSPFAGSSVFDQNPVFGVFGSTTLTSPFVSAGQPSQPAFGSSIFGSSTPFGASSQQTFGSMSTPAINSSSIPEFGSTSTTTIGATSPPVFGSTTSPTFDSTGSGFRVSSPPFGAGGGFGASSTPLFGSSTTLAFGTSETPPFGASTPSFTFGSTQTLGQSTSAFNSNPFGSTSSPFRGQSSPFGSQTPSSAFGGQRGGSRVINFAPTAEEGASTFGQTAKLESISAMPFYKDKSHEELRWEDYQIGDKYGGTYEQTAKLVSISAMPIYKDKSHEEPRWEDYQIGDNYGGTSGQAAKLESISAMPIYKDNSHEELRWEDYQIGDKALCLEVLRLVYLVHLNLHLLSPQQPPSVLLHQSLAVQCLLLCHHQLQHLVIHLHHLLLVLGGSGSTAQTSPFGIAGQLSQPTCGSKIFGSSTPFGASSQTFGSMRTPTFGSTTSPTFGSTSAFGVSSLLFGAGGGFGASSTALFGSSTTSAFGTSKTPAFGASSAPAFGASSTPLFSFGSTQTFGQSSLAFGSSPLASASSPFGGQSSPLGVQSPSSAGGIGSTGIGQSGFGGQRSGSTVARYAPTVEADGSTFGHTTKLDSKSAMPFYENKSHKELRWEDYQIGNIGSQSNFGGQRGGSRVAKYAPTAEADGGTSGQTATLKSISAMPIYKDKSHEGLKWEDHLIGDKVSQTSSAFGSTGIGPSGFGGQLCGSRVAKYKPTAEDFEETDKLESISAMPIYKAKSHEELRWEDYQIGDKGWSLNSTQSTGLVGFSSNTTQRNTFAPSPALGQSAANPFSTSTPSNPFASKSSAFCSGFGTTFTPFSSSAFATSTSATPPIFGSSTSTFGNTSPSSLFNSSPALGANLESENEEKTCCKFSELDLGKERVSSPRKAESQNEEEREVSGQEGYDSDRNRLPVKEREVSKQEGYDSAEHVSL